MITEIGDPIEVSAVFRGGRLRPVAFLWKSRRHRITYISGSYSYSRGTFRFFNYTVRVDGSDLYEISFNSQEMAWRLERIHAEG